MIATQENQGDLNMVSIVRNWKSVTPKTILILSYFISIFCLVSADSTITRGPAIGEIYYIGPTVTGEGIYHSTDFGETAVCVDSVSEVESICADLTPGSLYRVRMPDCLYYSNNYGQYGSWVFRTAEGSYSLASSRNEGEIFKGPGMSSNDYGYSFTQHSLNGCLCSIKAFEIGNQDSIGYILGDIYGIPDSLFLLISYDNFENLEVKNVFNFNAPIVSLTRGYINGELYLYTYYWGIGDGKKLRYSSDYGETWELKNTFNCPNLPICGIVGGRQTGELFMNIEYVQLMGQIRHTYIYHSLDYGETFTIYHTFSYGDEPIYANFEATPTEGSVPLTVQFTDLSNGNVASTWEWDFQNDGIIDSYEQNPIYTYQDTGYYSVSLTIHPLQLDTATKYNFIHVTDGSGIGNDELDVTIDELTNYPNPFNPNTEIRYQISDVSQMENAQIEIYNTRGQKIKTLPINGAGNVSGNSVWWNGTDQTEKPVTSGLYLYKLNTEASPVKKMLLLK